MGVLLSAAVCAPVCSDASSLALTPRTPALGAPGAIVIEADTGAVIYSYRSTQRRAIASTTKLMSAYVTLEHAQPDRVLTVQPYTPAPEETVAGLRAGQRLSVSELLKAMLLPSAGDAANTLAVDLGGSVGRFVDWMNASARRLHLHDTHYSTPVGLDTPGNYSTAADLARLTRVLMRNPTFAQIVDLPSARLHDGQPLVNRNDLVGRFGYVTGVKTGHTAQAGYCLVGAASEGGVKLISVVLGDGSESARDSDTLSLLHYGFELYRRSQPVSGGRVYARVAISGGGGKRLALVAEHTVRLILRRGSSLKVYLKGVPAAVRGPLRAHSHLGEVVVRENGRIVAEVALRNRLELAGAAAASPLS